MRPRIICHMIATIDGKIDGASLKAITKGTEYEETGSRLGGDAWVCGRVTMQQHFAEEGTFASKDGFPAGPQPVHVARCADSYAIAIDTHGSLLWDSGDLDGEHLISVVSEQAQMDYLAYLRDRQISYIVAILMFVGMAHAISALILRWPVQGAVAVLWWAGGIGMYFIGGDYFLAIFVAEMFFGMVLFGLYAMWLDGRERQGRANANG